MKKMMILALMITVITATPSFLAAKTAEPTPKAIGFDLGNIPIVTNPGQLSGGQVSFQLKKPISGNFNGKITLVCLKKGSIEKFFVSVKGDYRMATNEVVVAPSTIQAELGITAQEFLAQYKPTNLEQRK